MTRAEAYEHAKLLLVGDYDGGVPKKDIFVNDLYDAFDLELKLLRKELETARKERDYWKLSFQKQVEVSRG
jgi:hypothetical protein